jgi:metal-responsive CopG/Arc/MetJ family transcriptional regulator
MEIISMSIDKKTREDLDLVQKKLGIKSRSKLLRATINSILNEYSALDDLFGHCDVVFTITHRNHMESGFSKIMSEYEEIIRTEIHQHHNQVCLRIVIVCGDAPKIRNLYCLLRQNPEVASVNFSIL